MSMNVLTDLYLVASNSSTQPPGPGGYVCIGYWDVQGDSGRGTDGNTGHYMMGLYAKFAQVDSLNDVEYIQDVFVTASESPTPIPLNDDSYGLIGCWDAGNKGAVATNGGRGTFMAGMYIKKATGGNRYIRDIQLTVCNNAFPDILGNDSPYMLIGYWDADAGGAVGTDGSTGHDMAGLFVRYATATATAASADRKAQSGMPVRYSTALLLMVLVVAGLLFVASKQHAYVLGPIVFAIAGFFGGLIFRREA